MQEFIEARREAIVKRLEEIRIIHQKCLNDVTTRTAYTGSDWSIADLLRHASGRGYRDMVTSLVQEDNPELPTFDLEIAWENLTKTSLGMIDEALEFATTLSLEQLSRYGERNGKSYGVLDGLETWTAHFEEHFTQLRDEIRPREGLPNV
jgi:hypothetical protein